MNPSADMASVNPKWVAAKSADAVGSGTFRDRAVPVISMTTSRERILYDVYGIQCREFVSDVHLGGIHGP